MGLPNSRATYDLAQQAAEEEVDEGEEDFYGISANTNGTHESQAGRGASDLPVNGTSNITSTSYSWFPNHTGANRPSSADQQKADNQRRAAVLRAKLIAQRQNTPVQGPSRSNTPSKMVAVPPEETRIDTQPQDSLPEQHDSSSDVSGLESLLAEGKAAAEAKMNDNKTQAEQPASNENATLGHPLNIRSGQLQIIAASDADNQNNSSASPTQPTDLTEPYYTDLPIWLEVTGYHDVAYRSAKLSTYKERKALEEEAARIADRLEKLRQAEQAEIVSLRSAAAHPAQTHQLPPPPLPNSMPTGAIVQKTPVSKAITPAATTNGVKRAHSPEPALAEKAVRRRESPTNFRIRGVNETPEKRGTAALPAHSPPSTGLERRVSYPEARRKSNDDFNRAGPMKPEPRDPSLERRQAFYKRDGGFAAPAPTYTRDNRFDRTEYPTHGASRVLDHQDRPERGYSQHYKGSAGLDLKKGGQSYPRFN